MMMPTKATSREARGVHRCGSRRVNSFVHLSMAERQKAVDPRQHEEIERDRRQVDCQMREPRPSAPVNAPPAPGSAELVSIAATIKRVYWRISTNAAGTT